MALTLALVSLLGEGAQASTPRVSSRGGACVAGARHLLSATTQPVGTAPCPGVRPGTLIRVEGSTCTTNFLFHGSDGTRYIGTAGHCTLESDGEIVYAPGEGPEVNGSEGRIGEIAYAVRDTTARDFALIRIDPDVKAKPAMCFYGGPAGLYRERSPDPVRLNYYGNATGVGNLGAIDQPVVPARSGVALDTMDRRVVFAQTPAGKGDSGAGVIEESTQQAIGVLVGLHREGVAIMRLGPRMAEAEAALGVDLKLITAS